MDAKAYGLILLVAGLTLAGVGIGFDAPAAFPFAGFCVGAGIAKL